MRVTVCRRHYEIAVGGLKEVKTDAKFVLLVSLSLPVGDFSPAMQMGE